jgi:lysyl-tRNA synthetase class 2
VSDWRASCAVDAAVTRAALKQRARDYFAMQGVLEVDTPALSAAAGSDPNIESLVVLSELSPDRRLFLHTSPEFCMKRLLAAGYPDIYSICRVYRDAESGHRHQPEFTMIEWYRRGFGLQAIIDDTLALLGNVLQQCGDAPPADQLEYAAAFRQHAGLDPLHATIAQLAARAGADADLRQALGESRDAWLDLLLATVVAPEFASDRFTVVRHYPASQAALARRCPADQRIADRFEVFMADVEIANGYVELTDAAEQARRIDDDLQQRATAGKAVNPADKALLAALRAGLPECAGVAVGLERLQMLHDNTDNIGDVVTFVFGQAND